MVDLFGAASSRFLEGMTNNMSGLLLDQKYMFSSNNDNYVLLVSISNEKETLQIHGTDIVSLIIKSEINNLCITGTLDVFDTNGTLGTFFGGYFTHCNVRFCHLEDKQTTKLTSPFPFDIKGNEDFSHVFIVSGYEIKSRNQNKIHYQLKLISTNWYRCVMNCEYSTYLKEGQQEPISDILKSLFEDSFKGFNDEVYKEAKSGGILGNTFTNNKFRDITLKYISSGNDNLFTSYKYLMNKFLISKSKRETNGEIIKTIPFLVYDWLNHKYELIDPSNDETFLKGREMTSLMSFAGTLVEKLTVQTSQQLGSRTKAKMTKTYESLFDHIFWEYDTTLGTFSKGSSLKNKDLISVFANSEYNADGYDNKFSSFNKEIFKDDLKFRYKHNGSEWNNDYSIYNDFIDTYINENSLIVNIRGNITHQPGMGFVLVDDKGIKGQDGLEESLSNSLNDKKKNKNILGYFHIVNSTQIIAPNLDETAADSNGITIPRYSENLVLARFSTPGN